MNRPAKRTRPLPVDGLQRAQRDGRRRRHRAVGTAGGGVTALLVLVVGLTLLGGSAGSQSLDIADDPTPTAAASASPEASSEATPDPQAPSPEATTSGYPDCSSGGECVEGEEYEPDCVNNDCYEDDGGPQAPLAERPAYTEAPREQLDDFTCLNGQTGGQPVDGAVCQRVTGPDSVRRGEDLVVSVRICAASNAAGAVTLTFPGGGEQDLVVEADTYGGSDGSADEPEVVWTFAGSVGFTGSAHERTLLPRQCLVYTRTWPTAFQDGTPVPAGRYQLTTFSLASARNGTSWSRDDQFSTSYPVEVVG